MARLDQAQLLAAAKGFLAADADPTGKADLVGDKGSAVVAADPGDMKAAFKRIKKVDGFRWVVINREDLFAANALSIGSKAGILDAEGAVLKEADVPRKRM